MFKFLLILLTSFTVFAADKKYSDFPQLNQADWASGDLFLMSDVSANASKKTTVGDFDGRYVLQSGTLGISQGGTGQTTAANAINALLPSQSGNSGKYLTTNGSVASWGTLAGGAGSVTHVGTGTGLSGGPITSVGTISLANTAVSPGSYTLSSITVDAQGRLTSASNGSAVTSVASGTGLSGGPITATGTISLANTAVTPGSYTNADITVDAQGRITSASNGSGAGANTSLSNLSSVAINTALLPDTDLSYDLGGAGFSWTNAYFDQIRDGADNAAFSSQYRTLNDATGSAVLDFYNSGTLGVSINANFGSTLQFSGGTKYTFPSSDGSPNYFLKTNGSGVLSWAATGGVSHVALTAPSFLSVSGSPVTSAGTLALTLASQTANNVFAAPDGSSGAPTFRALATGDMPTTGKGTLSTSTTGVSITGGNGALFSNASVSIQTASGSQPGLLSSSDWTTFNNKGSGSVTSIVGTAGVVTNPGAGITTVGTLSVNANLISVGTLAIANGGTGASTKATAFDALSPMTSSGDIIYGGASGTGTRLAAGSNGQVLALSGGVPVWSAAGSGNTVSANSGGDRIERARIQHNGTCSIISQSGSWISSISTSATGQCALTYTNHFNSTAPTCAITLDVTGSCYMAGYSVVPTASTLTVRTFNNLFTSANCNWDIICQGPF